MIKTKFLQTCIGVSIVLLSLGFLFQSVQKATASPTLDKFLQQKANNIGKYMMSTTVINGGVCTLVWDTETGKSVTYFGFKKDGDKAQLPENPLAN